MPSSVPSAAPTTNQPSRTLLVAPPSLSSRQDVLQSTLEQYDRSTTDLQMLDRLEAGLVNLPPDTYDSVLLLAEPRSDSGSNHDGNDDGNHDGNINGNYGGSDDGQNLPPALFIKKDVMLKLVASTRAGGKISRQNGTFGTMAAERTEALLAGLLDDGTGGMVKPSFAATDAIPLKLARGKGDAFATAPTNMLATDNNNKSLTEGVGYVDFGDDLEADLESGDDDDDELIDENELLTEEDLTRPVVQPLECRPKTGKRRRACKDCTCGLKQKIEAEDAAKRADADKALDTLKLGVDDLAEVDFTVPGKVGSCGNCALGDAFRCDGCPYIGLPAFKPGEEVRLLNNDVQL